VVVSLEIVPTRKVRKAPDQDVPDLLRADRQIEVVTGGPSSGAAEIALQRMMKGPIPNTGPPVSPFSYEERQRRYEVWEAGGDPDVEA
jgi:hypothetical protein